MYEKDRRYVFDGTDEMLKRINDSTSPVLVIKHLKRKNIPKKMEVLAYDSDDFLSDVGGLMGIFLGASLWSSYEKIVRPTVEKVKKIVQRK